MGIFHITSGTGPDVVMLHPFPSSHEFWMATAEKLTSRYRVTLLDLRGHGRSGVGFDTIQMSDHATDVERVCRDAGIQKAVFIGSSLGGYVLFELWRSQRERFRALVLANTRAIAESDESRIQRLKSIESVLEHGTAQFVETTLKRLIGETTRRSRPDIVEAARRTTRLSSPEGIAAVQRGMAVRPDSIPTLASIDVPTLLLGGEEDVVSSAQEMADIQKRIPGSKLIVMRRVGHFAPFEDPEESTKAIRSFLDGLVAA
jgi:3-oxoadipate enol-lactonase